MADKWIDVYGIVSATSDISSGMANYDTNGSDNVSSYVANNTFTIPTGTTYQEMYNTNGLKISGYVKSDGSGIGFKIELNGKTSENARSAGAGTYQNTCSIGVLWNENNYGKIIFFIPVYYVGSAGWMGLGYYPNAMKTDIYNWIVNNPILYGAAGGGSGYIESGEIPTYNKYMVGYKVPTTDDPETKTRSTTKHSPTAISNYAKEGNGFCRITYLGPIPAPKINKITYDGVFGYVYFEAPIKWRYVEVFCKEGSMPIDNVDPDCITFAISDGEYGPLRSPRKIPLKGNTTYYFAIRYKGSSYYDPYYWAESISYTTGASTVSGIEVVDLTNMTSTRMKSAAFNTFINSTTQRNDFAGDEVIENLANNYTPPTYPSYGDDEVYRADQSDDDFGEVILGYYNYYDDSRERGYCSCNAEADNGTKYARFRSIQNGNVSESQLESNYVNTFMFVIDHDRRMGQAVCISGQTLSTATISINNYFNEIPTINYRTALAVWYRFLYENMYTPPSEYSTYLDQINGSGFYWKDYNNPITPNHLVVCKAYPFKNYSWCSANSGSDHTFNDDDLTNGTEHAVYASEIKNIYITTSGNSYTCSFTFTGLANMFSYAPNYDGGYETTGYTWDNWNQQYPNVVARAFNQKSGSMTISLSGTLEYIFQRLQRGVRNVNIFVNGRLWSRANN